jgi:hypothetical protein
MRYRSVYAQVSISFTHDIWLSLASLDVWKHTLMPLILFRLSFLVFVFDTLTFSRALCTKQKKPSKGWVTAAGFRGKREIDDLEDDDGNISPELTAREMKKMRQDATLMTFFHENHAVAGDGSGEVKESAIPDNHKTEELMEAIEKKLELPHDMCQQALEKLHKNGYIIVAGLKTLKKDGWERLDIPLAIEEELKNQLHAKGTTSLVSFPRIEYAHCVLFFLKS